MKHGRGSGQRTIQQIPRIRPRETRISSQGAAESTKDTSKIVVTHLESGFSSSDVNSPSSEPGRASTDYSNGAFSVHWFQLFNAVAFQIMMGAPIILFAKSLGASSTVLGIVAAFTPLMTVMQLPATRFLERCSYRQFVLSGWGLRTIFIFVVAVIPVLWFLDAMSKLALLLATLFLFNLLRGISSAGIMPWIAAIIPESIRGRFLAVDQFFMYLGSLFALCVSAMLMSGKVDDWEYSLVFLVSAIGGTVSLYFIKRIPDAPAEDVVRRSAQPVPWLAILKYPPFLRLLIFNLLFMVMIGSLGVFTVEYLREFPKFDPHLILLLSAVSFIGPLLSLLITGRVIDAIGSKPLLRAGLIGFIFVLAGWCMIAGGLIPCTIPTIVALNFLSGLSGANFSLANTRIMMATMPEMGRNHFFALFTVITSLGLGAAPVVWGISLDAIGTYEFVTDWFSWRKHSIYFAALMPFAVAALVCVNFLVEAKAGQTLNSSVHYAKLKRMSKNWQR